MSKTNKAMAAYKICGLLLSFLLLQGAFCQPIPQQETEAEAIAHAKFNALINEYSAKFANLARDVLKDEALVNNHDREIQAFKQSLSLILLTYETATNVDSKAEVIQYFANLPRDFENKPEESLSQQTMVMKEVIERYGLVKLSKEAEQEFDKLMAN